ncbi:unnamed protein product, partial [Amoebophrya sp. A25]
MKQAIEQWRSQQEKGFELALRARQFGICSHILKVGALDADAFFVQAAARGDLQLVRAMVDTLTLVPPPSKAGNAENGPSCASACALQDNHRAGG